MATVAPAKASPTTQPQAQAKAAPKPKSYAIEGAVLAAVLLAACGHLLIKQGLNSASVPKDASIVLRLLQYLLTPMVAGGLLVYATGTMLWIAAVSKLAISYVYPITALNYVVISLGGMWILGESVSLARWGGIGVVLLGVALMHTSNTGENRG